jgi:hypothetical protein
VFGALISASASGEENFCYSPRVLQMNWRRGAGLHLAVLAGYVATALVFSWPLARHLSTHLTGPPDGDTGVYVWNQWVFQHEILAHQRLPFFTDSIFSLTQEANLSLHNYTTFQNLLALPLSGVLGVVATFNVVFLSMSVLTAYTTFLLARHVTGRSAEAWLAGVLFAWSPLMVTRGMGHFSLVAAAPLAIFLLVLMRADGHERFRDAVALGAVVAWAALADVYYGVYCLLMGAAFLVARVLAIQASPQSGRAQAVRWAIDVLLLCAAGLVGAIALTGGWTATIFGFSISARSLYTPVLVLTALALMRAAWHVRASPRPGAWVEAWRLAFLTSAACLVTTALLSPVLYAVGKRITGNLVVPGTPWRSSPAGVDLLALVLPNPNHPMAPDWIAGWLKSFQGEILERVVSIPLLVIVVLFVAWRTGWRPSRWWAALAIAFGALALGPFVHVAGVNTYVPGPWAVLRYVPLLGLARTPSRFSVVMMLAIAVLFAAALEWLGRTHPKQRRLVLATVALLLFAELLPSPVSLHSAAVPKFYARVAAAPDDVRVLELPTGIRDGTLSVGNFSARSQFFQTSHGQPLIGGYLSRVANERISESRRIEMIDALIALSEGGTIPPQREAALLASGPTFVRDARLGFVIVDRVRASPPLIDFAQRALRLRLVEVDGVFDLYQPSP